MIDPDVMKDVPADQAPLSLSSWRLSTPGILAGQAESDEIAGEAWCHVDQNVASRLLNQFRKETNHTGPAALKIGDIPQADFLRFLAKIAHGYAIANCGFDQFKHLAPDIILGRSKALCYVVGGEWEIPPPDTDAGIFDLKLGEAVRANTTYVVVGVRVYPFMGTPQHIVVVGRR